MELVFALILIAILGYSFLLLVQIYIGFQTITALNPDTCTTQHTLPRVSIILSALNEEDSIKPALLSLLQLSYPHIELIVINDRSTDRTGEILQHLAEEHSSLRVCHVHELPPGWFGKNHALHLGASMATGEWLLFTDADIHMHPSTLTVTMQYVLNNNFDHITLHEKHLDQHFGQKILLLGHYVSYGMVIKPWLAHCPQRSHSVGLGAFNLVRKSTYKAVGGHQAIALECLDDVKLGGLIKRHGFKQNFIDGRSLIEREWYSSLKHMIEGWKKNSFAYYDYKLLPAIRDTIFACMFYGLPFVGLFFNSPIWIMSLFIIMLTFTLYAYVAKWHGLPIFYALFYPFSIACLLFTIWNSARATYQHGGVIWRGTLYPLKQLKSK